MQRYNPKDIEPKWQKKWQDSKIYRAIDFDSRPKFVMLTEFPYPSGDGLHLGHCREYTLGDVIARHKRMLGMNVLYPMGYDAFGLPTENYAIKHKIAPQTATDRNVTNFQAQFESLGLSFDWQRSFRTSDPDYYRWTQWLFLQFYKQNMAYQAETTINWCPFCKTGLANEEVVNGRHERCDTIVEKRLLKQWLMRITDYADRLIEGLKDVDYPSRIADQQIHWIGRSSGAEIDFQVFDTDKTITVFTTRADTIFSAAFIVVAPEHPHVADIVAIAHKARVNSYIVTALAKTDVERQADEKSKTGIFSGTYAVNPANDERIPIWIADFVLASYGTGAIFGDIHDERDFEFIKKFNIPARVTVVPQDATAALAVQAKEYPYSGEGVLIDSADFSGQISSTARPKIIAWLEGKGLAREKTNYRLRDWIFSRQHYWGEPIPIIHCPTHGPVPVPEEQLPVLLPTVENYEPTESGESPLSAMTDWVDVPCPTCGGPAKRETDTMPNWAGSSWYYLRFYDAHNSSAFADRAKLDYWGEVDLYLGGMEHTTLHLLYSRFWHQFLYDQGFVPKPEPYKARRGQGIVLAADGTKMSKSKGNIVNPSEIIASGYGADALRLAIAFLAPYDQTTPWSPESVAGTHRFLQRIWVMVQEYGAAAVTASHTRDVSPASPELQRALHKAIQKVTADINTMSFNTAVSALMELVNELYRLKAIDAYAAQNWPDVLCTLTQLAAPFAPHITEEIWQRLGQEGSVHVSEWPRYDEAYLVADSMTIAVQVNGKVRAELHLAARSEQSEIEAAALANPHVQAYTNGKTVKKVIYVSGKIVSIVV